MPIYEHQCECGYTEEKILPLSADNPSHCGVPMKRLISIPGHIAFKGGGFYATEYGKQSHNLDTKSQQERAKREVREAGLSIPAPFN